MQALTSQQVWQILEEVKDPEIPVVSVVEMGLIRQVAINKDHVLVRMTPTFAGCPALQVMRSEIENRLQQAGAEEVQVQITLSPPWTTDWITAEARKKLKGFGLAPPPQHDGDFEKLLQMTATCPYCDSQNTQLKNDFGPTLCRAIYVCQDCKQPFEQFKPV
jgi:ring-1,2-phenylacetyl-CoA epoxidase subunit PaaD